MDEWKRKYRTFDPSVLAPAAEAMGAQQILLRGVPDSSHFARVLVSADFHMKSIAMKLTDSGVKGLPSYLDLLKAKRRMPTSATPRWWMACNYEPLARSEDKTAWQIRGPGVKVMTENDFVAPGGQVRGSGQQDPIAREWADAMTQKYEELTLKNPVFGELRNIMDLCVVAALVKKENLSGLAGCELPTLLGGKCRDRLRPARRQDDRHAVQLPEGRQQLRDHRVRRRRHRLVGRGRQERSRRPREGEAGQGRRPGPSRLVVELSVGPRSRGYIPRGPVSPRPVARL